MGSLRHTVVQKLLNYGGRLFSNIGFAICGDFKNIERIRGSILNSESMQHLDFWCGIKIGIIMV